MDVMESNASTEVAVMEEKPQVDFLKYLRDTIARGSLDFDTWTSLITDIEKYYPDDIETISLVYDSFLSKFPLCHVYWKKYVDHKTHLCTVDKAVEICQRAVQSATYCVGLWVDYCSFSIAAFEDPFDIRSANMLEDDVKRRLKSVQLEAKKSRLRMWTNYAPPIFNSKTFFILASWY